MTTFGISELDISYFKHFHHSYYLTKFLIKIIFIVLSINKKCVSVLSTLETESSAVHIAHKGKKLYSSYISFWDMVWLRFGRKDHMTRHAKKTHANFYDSSERLERTRLISTPLPGESILFSFGLICSHSVSWSNFTGEEEEELASRVAPSRKERWVLNCSYKECHNEQGGKP